MSSPQNTSPDQSFQNRLNRVAERSGPESEESIEVQALPDIKERIKYPAILLGLAVVGLLGFAYLMPEEPVEVAETAATEKKLPTRIKMNN